MRPSVVALFAAWLLVSGCRIGGAADGVDAPHIDHDASTAPDAEPPADGSPVAVLDADASTGDLAAPASSLDPIPVDTVACEHPEYWPLQLASATYPVLVHYREPAEQHEAERVLAYVEHAWQLEVDVIGFRPPRPDEGACGPDDRFDVFVWRDKEECFVDVIADDPSTPYDDRLAFLVVDPYGPYGGDLLAATVAHELNHACQSADDWEDAPAIYEMTSVLMEEAVYGDDNGYQQLSQDFQDRPDWSIDRDDQYKTWFMYGAALYLMYLRDRFFDGGYTFAAQMWLAMRNPAGDNEPDFADAIDGLLQPFGTKFVETVPEFARWRWFTGAHADGAHLAEGAALPSVKQMGSYRVDKSRSIALTPAPMLLGTSYVELYRQPGDAASVKVSLAGAATDCRWVVQAVPGVDGSSDGETLDLSSGSATITFGGDGRRTLVLTALPLDAYDPDLRDDSRYDLTLLVKP